MAAAALVLFAAQFLYFRSRRVAPVEARPGESDEKFASILSIAADAIVTVDQTQRIINFNRGAEEIFGYAATDAIGRHLSVLLPPRFRDAHSGHMERFARSPETARRMGERREIFGLRANGTEFPAEASISKLVAPDGILFTVVLRDITTQRRAEEDERFLAEASAAFAQALALDATMRATVDLAVPRLADVCFLDLVRGGGAYQRTVSRHRDPAIQAILDEIYHRPLTEDSPSPIVDVIRRGRREIIESVDVEWLTVNSDPVVAPQALALAAKSIQILPLRAAGDMLGAITFLRLTADKVDADQRSLAEKYAAAVSVALANAKLYAEARQANLARDEVLSVVSHDLRNPISAISMCARSLRLHPPSNESERTNLLLTIEESTALVNRLIEDLVDVANIERGNLSLEIGAHEPSQLALQAMHMFDVEAEEHGIALEARLSTNLPLVATDGARIVQVLGNLIRNAIKFTPRDGSVTVSADARDGMVLFRVADTGRGISHERQRRIFDRYWQSSEGARSRGSGLGLSIAKGIVEAHGGTLMVESEVGQGSVFTFSVPRAASAGRTQSEGEGR